VLVDHWAGAWRILGELRGLHGVTVHTLICNNASRRSASRLRQRRGGVPQRHRRPACVLSQTRFRLHVRLRPLHHDTTLGWLQRERYWIGLHGMGVIYRDAVLASFGRGLLNAHIGLLPEFRGRSVMEWSILSGAPAGITVFFMDGGIDTGREIVVRRSFDVSRAGSAADAKASLFRRDGEMYRQALERWPGRPQLEPVNEGGRRYFVMSRLLTAVVDELIESGAGETTWRPKRASVWRDQNCYVCSRSLHDSSSTHAHRTERADQIDSRTAACGRSAPTPCCAGAERDVRRPVDISPRRIYAVPIRRFRSPTTRAPARAPRSVLDRAADAVAHRIDLSARVRSTSVVHHLAHRLQDSDGLADAVHARHRLLGPRQ
jgi:hypothetical protein